MNKGLTKHYLLDLNRYLHDYKKTGDDTLLNKALTMLDDFRAYVIIENIDDEDEQVETSN